MVKVRPSAWGSAWLLALTVLIFGPALTSRGYSLVGDMVFVPDQPWKWAWIGGDGGVPRAVPSDALVTLTGTVIPGDLVQKILLVSIVLLGGCGILRSTRDLPMVAGAVAATFYVWNPFVHQRLATGQWALLVGYSVLPWVLESATRYREEGLHRLPVLVAWLAVAGWSSPTGGVLAVIVALAGLGRRRPVRTAAGLAGALVVNLPWLLPGFLNGTDRPPDPDGVAAFAARADTPYGLLGSLLSLGGIWKTSVVTGERASWLLSGLGLGLAVLAGLALVLGRRKRVTDRSWLTAGAIGFVVPVLVAALATDAGQPVARWLVTTVPGGGLVRDTQKWVALTSLPIALGLGLMVGWLAERLRNLSWSDAWLMPLAVVPLAMLPSLGWGLWGTLEPADYPAEWSQVRTLIGAEEDTRSAVLPSSTYRRFGWAADRAVLDPAPRFFPGDVTADDTLVVDDQSVDGESSSAARIREAERRGELAPALADEGVRWVIVHGDSAVAERYRLQGRTAYEGKELTLVDLGTGGRPRRSDHATTYAVVDLTLLGVVLGGLLWRRGRA